MGKSFSCTGHKTENKNGIHYTVLVTVVYNHLDGSTLGESRMTSLLTPGSLGMEPWHLTWHDITTPFLVWNLPFMLKWYYSIWLALDWGCFTTGQNGRPVNTSTLLTRFGDSAQVGPSIRLLILNAATEFSSDTLWQCLQKAGRGKRGKDGFSFSYLGPIVIAPTLKQAVMNPVCVQQECG